MTTTFDADKARRRVARFVESVDDPTLHWAWEVTQGLVGVYATASMNRGDKLPEKLTEYWHDLFESWHGGAANYGLIGMMTEFGSACPEEMQEEQEVIMAEAFALGKGEPVGTKKRVLGILDAQAVVKPAPTLRLVVDNTVAR
jgi:hypothetical protein